jgi:hypothetical protein
MRPDPDPLSLTVLLVAKKELVSALQGLLQSRRLSIASTLPDTALLVKELETFKAKVTLAQAETLEDWRERPHDDLVLALAIAAWLGEKALPGLDGRSRKPDLAGGCHRIVLGGSSGGIPCRRVSACGLALSARPENPWAFWPSSSECGGRGASPPLPSRRR